MPRFQKFFRPVLAAYRNGEKQIREVVQEVGEYFPLTEEEMQERLSSGNYRVYDRVSWARTYLTAAELLKSTKRGYSEITPQGLKVLESQNEIDTKYLKRFESFRKFIERRSNKSDNQNENPEIEDEQDGTPEELFERSLKTINASLSQELLTRIHDETPQFFEKLIVDLLMAMGYGGREGMGDAIGKSGDRGVDGVIDQDVLGVDKIYCQAKCYAPDNRVSSGDIRDFSGALNLHGVTKGIFVTSSSFTQSAKDTAEKLNQNIILINGQELAELMIRYSVGCQKDKTYEIKKIDEDYFDSSM